MVHHSLICAFALLLLYLPCLITAQQAYGDNNCPVYDTATSALGYNCNGGENRTCQSFLFYRTKPPYTTLSSIASLFSTNVSQVSAINNISESATLKSNIEVIVPVTCSCVGTFYQANTTHVVQMGDNYYVIANDVFEGLTTCNAIQNQKIRPDVINIYPDERLTIPIRCACPSWFQIEDGVRYLMSFVIQQDDTVANIANKFRADLRQTLMANGLSPQNNSIQPLTTLLVPLQNLPNVSFMNITDGLNGPSHINTNVVVASVSTALATLIILLLGVCFCFYRHKVAKNSTDLEEFIALKSLHFDFKTIRKATDNFSQRNKLGQGGFGGVYKGILQNGQEMAVKRLPKNSRQGTKEFKTEVLLVEKLQHHNLVKLLGFCLHGEEKLLIYELLPNASLDKVLRGIVYITTRVTLCYFG